MPLPRPTKNEDEGGFMDRCMADGATASEYPDVGQRAAVCHAQWRNRGEDAAARLKDFLGEG